MARSLTDETMLSFEQLVNLIGQAHAELTAEASDRLIEADVSRTEARELRRYRRFYLAYPQIRESVSPELTSQFLRLRASNEIRESVTPVLGGRHSLTNLSLTHFVELIAIHDPLKRAFYETECLRGYWSVRELKRQIASHYYVRSGFSCRSIS